MPWCVPLSGPVIPGQPARVICNNPASNSQRLSQKPLVKCSSRQRLRAVFHPQVGCLCSDKSLHGKQNLAEAYCDRLLVVWWTTCAASSTFIYTFYYDLMHSLIPSTGVTPSQESILLLTQLFSVNFYWAVLQCHFMFYILKIIIKFCFRKLKLKKSLQVDSWCMTFLSQNLQVSFSAFTSKFFCYLLLSW